LPERRCDLVLRDFHLHDVPDNLLVLLDLRGAPNLDAHGRVEFQSHPAGRRFGIPEDNADLVANLVDEDETRARRGNDRREFPECLRHEPRMKSHVLVAHLTLDFCLRDERGDGINDDDINARRAHERLDNVERLLASVRLRDE
jgi:hypothetical protein